MHICRLKPDHNTCCSCIDTQVDTGVKKDCEDCREHSWVKLLTLGSSIFGRDYAFVAGPITNWKAQKVDVKRIGLCYFVKDEDCDEMLIRHDDYYKEKEKESK